MLLATCGVLTAAAQESAPNFRLIDQDGHMVELYRYDQVKTLALVAFEYGDEALLEALPKTRRTGKRKSSADIHVLLVQTDPAVSRTTLANLRQSTRLEAPILLDYAGSVSRSFGLQQAGDIVLIDPAADWKILGRTRDLSVLSADGSNRGEIEGSPAIAVPAAAEAVSYSRDIAPLLQARCINCHKPGGIGPFAMTSHKKVKGWADMMAEVILTKRMPPWHADPAYQHFNNSLALSPAEENTLMTWLRAGAPKEEDEPDPLADAHAPQAPTWALGEPDHILRMPEAAELPAEGVVDYKYFYVPSGLTEDKWVRGLEVRAGNPAVVHHALIFVEYPRDYAHVQPQMNSGLNGFFGSFLPGAEVRPFPEGTAQFLPAGTTFIFQMHYNVTGKPETDQTEIGLYFTDVAPKNVLQVSALATEEFKIRPEQADQPVSLSRRLNSDLQLWGMLPHMHYRGQRFRYTIEAKTGEQEVLLNVPWYQFDWQPMYWLDAPLTIPAGTTLRVDGAFDNSVYNPTNPDPSKTVYFGEQSFDEMFIGYMMVSRPYEQQLFTAQRTSNEPAGAISEDGLIGTKWDVDAGRPLRFLKDGALKLAIYKGTWEIQGHQIVANLAGETHYIEIVGDDLFIEGQRMKRLE